MRSLQSAAMPFFPLGRAPLRAARTGGYRASTPTNFNTYKVSTSGFAAFVDQEDSGVADDQGALVLDEPVSSGVVDFFVADCQEDHVPIESHFLALRLTMTVNCARPSFFMSSAPRP